MLAFFLEHLDNFAMIGVAAYAYIYGRGKNETKAKDRDKTIDRRDRGLKIQLDELRVDHEALKAKHSKLYAEVSRMIEALERSYATMEYVHETFPSREVFEIRISAMKEYVTGKTEAFLEIMRIRREGEK